MAHTQPSATPRIPLVEHPAPELAQTLARTLADDDGRPLNIFSTMGQHPRLLKRFNVFAGAFATHGILPPRERELVVLRTAWRCRSAYEWGQHVLIARRCGVTQIEIDAVAREPLAEWPAEDAALLAFCDSVLGEVDVDDATWDAVAASYDDAALVELVMLVGLYRMVAGFLNSARVPLEPHLPGWPPLTSE